MHWEQDCKKVEREYERRKNSGIKKGSKNEEEEELDENDGNGGSK